MERREHQIGLLREKLAAHDPERFFRRGAALLSAAGKPVTGIGQLGQGVSIGILLRDGTATATVDRIERRQHNDNAHSPEKA
jgi:exonuclease VII large subunit